MTERAARLLVVTHCPHHVGTRLGNAGGGGGAERAVMENIGDYA